MSNKIKTFCPFPKSSPSPERREDMAWYHRSRWVQLRGWKLKINPVCETCQSHDELHVHHIKKRKTHPHLAFQLENLKTLCRRCHGLEEGHS